MHENEYIFYKFYFSKLVDKSSLPSHILYLIKFQWIEKIMNESILIKMIKIAFFFIKSKKYRTFDQNIIFLQKYFFLSLCQKMN